MKIKTVLPTLAMVASSALAQHPLASGLDKANMDLTVKPGADFYRYATGGWCDVHPLTAEYARYSQFEALNENNHKQLRELIENIASKQHPQGTLEQKIGSLYRLAMDSVRRNQEDYAPIQAMLNEIEAISTKAEISYTTARLFSRGIDCFFSLGCEADKKDAEWNLMQIDQGGISMGERNYYLGDDEPTRHIREAYRLYVRHLFGMTGKSATEAEKSMEAVMNIETRIARASYSATEQRDVEKNYHKMSYRQLLTDFPGIDWSTLFLLNGIPAVEYVTVNQPEPIHEVEKILAECTVEELKAYLYYKTVDDAANSLSDRFRAEAFNFYNHTMSGAEQDRPRWKRAISSVEGALGMAVGKMYVEKYFPESSKKRMEELVKNLQQALRQRIAQQTWMTEETKRQAYEKLDAFYVKIGYPDQWIDYSALNIDETLSYYENLVRATQFMSHYYIDKRVNKRTDRTEWLMKPQTVNAYYNPTTNEICFPAGILQPPFFNAEADDACNYGAIGVVIGHEMTHGFDDQGSQFDKDGNLKDWWTETDKANFKKRTDVMRRFFDQVEVLPGLNANGQLTLGENIADHGGLNIAFQALQNAMKTHPLPSKDGFTPEQRFFLSYGLIWANNIREEMLRKQVQTDPHSPARWRVNGALPHIEAWYKAFNISKKDPLYVPQKERVDVW
ncbi:MAG: M13 family metallopeptidase [Bacteroidales bacterium]|nr:M13 family metallopeptidase [Bacteroidales bacterium]MDY4558587.1 M13 family metallopeptidase [Alloprevotella sp.]